MCRSLKSLAACTTLFALALSIAPQPALAGLGGRARLEGLVLDLDGRAAAGHRIHLIDATGEDLEQSDVGKDGLYAFNGLEAGSYSLGVEMPDGVMALVASPPVRLGAGELARRDVKLMATGSETPTAAAQANYGLGHWWKGLSAPGKAWTIVGVLLAGFLIYNLLDDDEDPASPS
jgi:hypothetical protein